jgi:hypothetical protein
VTWTKFSYSASIDFETYETIHEPTLEVKISQGNFSMPTRMLVDSGAQHTLLNADFAPTLGIQLDKCDKMKVGGITGSADGYIHSIKIQIPKIKKTISTTAIFVAGLGTTGLLGQIDFFSKFEVKFERNKLSFYLKEVPVLEF